MLFETINGFLKKLQNFNFYTVTRSYRLYLVKVHSNINININHIIVWQKVTELIRFEILAMFEPVGYKICWDNSRLNIDIIKADLAISFHTVLQPLTYCLSSNSISLYRFLLNIFCLSLRSVTIA